MIFIKKNIWLLARNLDSIKQSNKIIKNLGMNHKGDHEIIQGPSSHTDINECNKKTEISNKPSLHQTSNEKIIITDNIKTSTASSETYESLSTKNIIEYNNEISVSGFISEDKNNVSDDLLKKKRKVKYNMITKRFEVEGEEDKIVQPSRDTTSKKVKIIQKFGKETKTYDLSNPFDCRTFQIDSFLNFKRKVPDQAKENQYIYKEIEDITNINMHDYCKDIQAILINPPWRDKGFSVERLKSLQLPLKAMKEGIIFIWVEKEYLSEILQFFEDQSIKYIENMVWAKLTNIKNKKSSNQKDFFDIRDLYANEDYEYFTKSKLTLLLFRKFLENSQRSLELRHQRSGDAVFDFIDENNPNYVPNEYAFKLIETLLPKANFKENTTLKMVEVWGYKDYKRKGWIHFVENN